MFLRIRLRGGGGRLKKQLEKQGLRPRPAARVQQRPATTWQLLRSKPAGVSRNARLGLLEVCAYRGSTLSHRWATMGKSAVPLSKVIKALNDKRKACTTGPYRSPKGHHEIEARTYTYIGKSFDLVPGPHASRGQEIIEHVCTEAQARGPVDISLSIAFSNRLTRSSPVAN